MIKFITNFIAPILHPNIATGCTQWKWSSNVCLSLVNWNNIGKLGGWKETITLPSVFEHIEMILDIYRATGDIDFPEYLVDPYDPFNPEQEGLIRIISKNIEIEPKFGLKNTLNESVRKN